MTSNISEEPFWLTEKQLQPIDNNSESTESNHDLPQDTNGTKLVSLVMQVEKEEEHEKGDEHEKNQDEERSVNSGTEENWDMVSPLLLSSSTSRVLRSSRLLYNDSINDDSEAGVVSPEFRDGILPGFVSPLEAFLTVASGFMALSFAALVVGSFSFSWSDTMLRVHINTFVKSDESNIGPSIEFDVPLYKNATFQTTLSIFQSSHSYMMVMMVIVSTLIAPFIWITVLPNLVVGMHIFSKSKYQPINAVNRGSRTYLSRSLRWWFVNVCTHERISQMLTLAEIFMKFSLSIIYVQSILLVCTSRITLNIGSSRTSITDYIDRERQEIEGDDEYDIFAQVVNRTRGGTVSYLMGISLGVATVALVRLHWRRHDKFLKHGLSEISEVVENDLPEVQSLDTPEHLQDRPNSIPPPISAFRLLNEVVSENYDVGQDVNVSDEVCNSDLQTENVEATQLIGSTTEEGDFTHKLRMWKFPPLSTILLVETGIISTIMLYPMFILPLIRLDYNGMAVPLISQTETFLTLWDIVRSVSINSGNGFLPFIATIMFWLNIIIAPLVSLVTCLSLWVLENWKTTKPWKIYSLLQFVHPNSNSTAFAISMLVTVASLNLVSDFLFNKYDICEIIAENLSGSDGEKCLVINGTLLPGFWFLLFQGLSLDVFVRTTLFVR